MSRNKRGHDPFLNKLRTNTLLNRNSRHMDQPEAHRKTKSTTPNTWASTLLMKHKYRPIKQDMLHMSRLTISKLIIPRCNRAFHQDTLHSFSSKHTYSPVNHLNHMDIQRMISNNSIPITSQVNRKGISSNGTYNLMNNQNNALYSFCPEDISPSIGNYFNQAGIIQQSIYKRSLIENKENKPGNYPQIADELIHKQANNNDGEHSISRHLYRHGSFQRASVAKKINQTSILQRNTSYNYIPFGLGQARIFRYSAADLIRKQDDKNEIQRNNLFLHNTKESYPLIHNGEGITQTIIQRKNINASIFSRRKNKKNASGIFHHTSANLITRKNKGDKVQHNTSNPYKTEKTHPSIPASGKTEQKGFTRNATKKDIFNRKKYNGINPGIFHHSSINLTNRPNKENNFLHSSPPSSRAVKSHQLVSIGKKTSQTNVLLKIRKTRSLSIADNPKKYLKIPHHSITNLPGKKTGDNNKIQTEPLDSTRKKDFNTIPHLMSDLRKNEKIVYRSTMGNRKLNQKLSPYRSNDFIRDDKNKGTQEAVSNTIRKKDSHQPATASDYLNRTHALQTNKDSNISSIQKNSKQKIQRRHRTGHYNNQNNHIKQQRIVLRYRHNTNSINHFISRTMIAKSNPHPSSPGNYRITTKKSTAANTENLISNFPENKVNIPSVHLKKIKSGESTKNDNNTVLQRPIDSPETIQPETVRPGLLRVASLNNIQKQLSSSSAPLPRSNKEEEELDLLAEKIIKKIQNKIQIEKERRGRN